MGSKKILSNDQSNYMHEKYHSYIQSLDVDNDNPSNAQFFEILRDENEEFRFFSNKQLSNQIIANRRVDGDEEWPNLSKWKEYLSPLVLSLLEKSNNACLLAIEIFNKPIVRYRTEGFIVFMTIAWTSLFHVIFLKDGIKIKYKETDNDYLDLRKCIRKYTGIRKDEISANLELLIELRDIIVHKDNPIIDERIFGYCQACVLNFIAVYSNYFKNKIKINNGLAYSIQLSEKYDEEQIEALKTYKTKNFYEIAYFLKRFEKELYDKSPEVYNSQYYAFRVYMIPKPVKENQAEASIEMIDYDQSSDEVKDKVQKVIFSIKETRVSGNYFKAGEVCKKVFEDLKEQMPENWKFTASVHHARCARYYKIREGYKTDSPEITKKEYCFYDPVFGQYIYTQQWIDFLKKKLKRSKEFEIIFKRKK